MSAEADFIARLRGLATHQAARGLADDAAILENGNRALVLTHDSMIAGVHYLPDQNMADVAWKLTARALSDLAAKGARPLGVLLGYQLSADEDSSAADAAFVSGLGEALKAFDAPLLGGDTAASSGPRTLSMTAIGEATHQPVPSRSGAKPGDQLYLTGPLGAAMIGYERLSRAESAEPDHEDQAAIAAYCRPVPLLEEGIALAPVVSAMMDVSDGLLLDARRMAEASNVTIAIESRDVPIATPQARRRDALCWGDDYQLLFTAPLSANVPSYAQPIGEVRPLTAHPILLDGLPPAADQPLGFTHDSSRS